MSAIYLVNKYYYNNRIYIAPIRS